MVLPVLLPAPTLTGLEREQQLSGRVVVAVVLFIFAVLVPVPAPEALAAVRLGQVEFNRLGVSYADAFA